MTLLIKNKKKVLNLKSLDALRGLLALYVLCGHARWLLWAGHSEWKQYIHPLWSNIIAYSSGCFRYGHEAVIIFFVLSGFFIHLRVSKQLAEKNGFQLDIVYFFKRRFHRLIPPYVFALLLTLIVDLIGRALYPTLYHAATGDVLLDNNFVNKGFSWTSIIPALFLLPSSLGKDFGTNGPFWSLSYEFVYYLLYPLWLTIRRFGTWHGYLTGISLALASIWFLPSSFIRSILIHYPIWLSGAIIAEMVVRKRLPKWTILISCFCSSIAFIAINLNLSESFKLLFYTLLGSSILLIVISLPIIIFRHPLHRFLEFLGIESYTIYICHFPLVAFVSAWTIETFGARPMNGWLAIGTVAITLLLCHLFFLLCERHFMHSRLKIESS
ncbi:acyltransferase [Xenococcus sp. PCC 7305]|uniref:acyltransferase family protein n=1 Tax=Xenococcus sp. PCC 7305 TaxID=102125 RepID=UPI0002D82F53|nr:acyltransferase [Xenococcus sp. PCC 7305]